MASDDTPTVVDAFDALLAQIEAQINLANKAGAHAFEQRKYDQARDLSVRAGQIVEFQDKIMELRLDWEETFGPPASEVTGKPGDLTGPADSVAALRTACLARVETHAKGKLSRRSGTTYTTTDGKLAVVCLASKPYEASDHPRYWFGFRRSQYEFLKPAAEGYLALACGIASQVLLVPLADVRQWLDSLTMMKRNKDPYWHIHITKQGSRMMLDRPNDLAPIDLSKYVLP